LWPPGLLVAGGAGAYLITVHGVPKLWAKPGSKETAVGVFFALGVSLVAWPMVRTWVDVLAIVQFCVLCWMNCSAIEDWENGHHARASVLWGAASVAVAAVLLLRERPVIACAETASALGLVALDRIGRRASPEAMRVLADVMLLSPLLFLHLAGRTG
jgi:hypothetical protein